MFYTLINVTIILTFINIYIDNIFVTRNKLGEKLIIFSIQAVRTCNMAKRKYIVYVSIYTRIFYVFIVQIFISHMSWHVSLQCRISCVDVTNILKGKRFCFVTKPNDNHIWILLRKTLDEHLVSLPWSKFFFVLLFPWNTS